jgi:hypothetical protein
MNTVIRASALAAMAAAASLAASIPASAADEKPDATIYFHSRSVGLIVGGSWGSGTLHYKGKDIPLKVSGMSAGAVGYSKSDARGDVFNLKQVSDIAGTYTAGAGQATIGGGLGGAEMKNSAGVVIKVHATSAGLNVKFGPSGVTIDLKK